MRAPRKTRGATLIALAFVLVLGISWVVVSGLGAAGNRTAINRAQNANALQQAKFALIGWVAQRAALSGENNPGRLPCPEAPGNIGTPNEGIAAGNCTLPAVGRLPWRTLGLDKLKDASGEPLWYVVSPGWALPNSNALLTINSNTPGLLSVDGQAAVALIIAPGPPLSVQASANCIARSQTRTVSPPDFRDYLECENASSPADASFATSGPSGSFNDQVLRVTTADVLPGIEAAIAKRIEREIVPELQRVFDGAKWGTTTNLPLFPNPPLFPFAAPPFVNPGPEFSTSDYRGALATFQGLLPFNQTQGCTADPANPRCQPTLVQWSAAPAGPVEVLGYGYIQGTPSCTSPFSPTMSQWECTGEYHEDDTTMPLPVEPWQPIRIEMTATFTNVAMGLRAIDTTKMTVEARDDVLLGPWQPQAVSYTTTMNSNGLVTLTFGATLPNIDVMGWGTYAQFRIRLERAVIGDHPLLDASNATTGWFARNEWYRLMYYTVAQGHTAASLPAAPACIPGTNCLTVSNLTPANNKRAILLLAGRSLANATRPNANLADYLDDVSGVTGIAVDVNRNGDTSFYQHRVSRTFNDRVIVVDANP